VATARPGSSVANQIIAADRPADRVGNVLDDRRRHISQGDKVAEPLEALEQHQETNARDHAAGGASGER
jgi:hypothetical protein